MRSTFKPLLMVALAFAALVAGCAQPLKKQAFNRESAAHIHTVVVTRSENQDEYQAYMLGHPGMGFGLIGGLVAAADMQGKTNRLTAAMDAKEVRLQERFSEKLKESLAKAGYQTAVVVLPKDTKPEQVLAAAKQRASGDAVLFVNLYGGYWAAGPSSDYFPRMAAQVKTFDTRTEKVLYEDTITYGYAMPRAETVHLASDPAFRFANIDLLVADPAKTRQGLYRGIDALAEQIVADLRKN